MTTPRHVPTNPGLRHCLVCEWMSADCGCVCVQGWTNWSVKTTHSADMDPRNFAKILLRNIREQFKDVWIGSRKPQVFL